MMTFAERTGLSSRRRSRRYLWTDAFAVCNFLGLARETGDGRFAELAVRLVDRVHQELGRHREDDSRKGWISGLAEAEGAARPTCGGLRIGKSLPERKVSEAFDPVLEWDRDGQYFHYLTKWTFALDQVARQTGEPTFHVWARELLAVAHHAFTYGPSGRRRMIWKSSIDRSRPLVPSMGAHDPLDGFVRTVEVEATSHALGAPAVPDLEAARLDFAQMLERIGLETDDPLGLGGLLTDAHRLAQIDAAHPLVARLLQAALRGVERYREMPARGLPAEHRLAFRELGLSIGLASVPMLRADTRSRRLETAAQHALAELGRYLGLREEIETFWLIPRHRESDTWQEHADINDVMLSTSLAPEGFVLLATPARTAAGDVGAGAPAT